MGFDCVIAALVGVTLDDLSALGLGTTGEVTSGDEALFEGGVYAAQLGDALALTSVNPRLGELVAELARTLGVRGVHAGLHSTSDVYVLEIVEGESSRARFVVEGELVHSEGEPWPEEAAFEEEEFLEDGTLEAFARLSGVELGDAWMDAEFHELAVWEFYDDADGPDDADGDSVDPADNWASGPEVAYPVDSLAYVDLASARVSSKVLAVLLGVGAVIEVLFGIFALAGESFGMLVPHLAFAAFAVLTLLLRRDDPQALPWMALSVLILIVSVAVTISDGNEHRTVLGLFTGFLVALLGALLFHWRRLRTLVRSVTG